MTTHSCNVLGPYTISDSTDLAEIETAIEALTYSATAKWIVVSAGSKFSVIQIDTA